MAAKLILGPKLWAQHGPTRARGLAFDASGRMLSAGDLAALFDCLSDRNAWLETAAALNGMFAAVKVDGAEIRACVDRLRSLPLFFARVRDDLIVVDIADAVDAQLPHRKLDSILRSEFRPTGYVTGAHTLIEGLYQIRAGHCFFHAPGEDLPNAQQRYYEFRHRAFDSEDDEALIRALVETHGRVFRRLLRSVGDRQVVIPLSGG